MENPKTTLTGIVALIINILIVILKFWKIELPIEVITGINTIVVFLIGLFAKDGKSNG